MDSIQGGARGEDNFFHVMPCQLSSTLKAAGFTGTFQYMAPEVLKQEPQQGSQQRWGGWFQMCFFLYFFVLLKCSHCSHLHFNHGSKKINTFLCQFRKLQQKNDDPKICFLNLKPWNHFFRMEYVESTSSKFLSNFDPKCCTLCKCCVLVRFFFDLEMTAFLSHVNLAN